MLKYFTLVFLTKLFLFGFAGVALAQDLPVAVVAVIDYTKILKNADAAKDVSLQIQKFRKKFSEEVRAEELRLRGVEAKLKRERSKLNSEEFNGRRKKFREQVLAAQKLGQDRKRQLSHAMEDAMRKIQRTVIPLVKEITKEYGYTLVVEKSQVLFASRVLEITDKVLQKLNQKLRTIKVPKPE